MSEYSQFAITNNGLDMIAEAEQAKLLTFTRVVLGDGQLSDTDAIQALASLKQEKLSVPIARITKSAEHTGQTTITAHISNDSVETGFYVREIGVMAKVGDGDEKLFSYAYGGNYVDYMPDKNSPVNINKIDITLVTGNAENITAVVDKTVYMTHGEVEEAIEAHNSNTSAHPALSAALTEHNSAETAHKNLLQVTATADKPASMSDKGLWVEIKDGMKSILHRWNKTTKTYDTLHPETDSAQITDWHSGIMASLASKTLGTVVDAITTDSVLGKLIKMLLNASGVKYLIDTNGYVCFGSFFGGLILQWGESERPSGYCAIANLPLSANVIKAIGTGSNNADDANYIKNVLRLAGLDTTSRIAFRTSEKEAPSVFYIAICR